MSNSDIPDRFPIPPPGTTAFFPSLLSYIRNTSIPIDPVVFQSILLCLIAGEKHLILRTLEEDVSLVVKLTALILTSVFSYPTHKLKIRPRPPPSQFHQSNAAPLSPSAHSTPFLRSLFLPSQGSNFNYNSQDESIGHKPRHAHKPNKHASRSLKSKQKIYTRSASFPNDLLSAARVQVTASASESTQPINPGDHQRHLLTSTATTASLAPSSFTSTYPANPFASASTLSSSDRTSSTVKPKFNFAQNFHRPPQGQEQGPVLPHAHTDPTLLTYHDSIRAESRLELPKALVISGLENASIPSQKALVRVLAEGRVVLESRSEKGGKGRGGSDRGSMGVRREGRRVEYEEEDEDEEDEDGVWNLPEGFITVYVCPMDPRERPGIHKSLLDKFAMSTTINLHHTTRHAMRSYSSSLSHPHLHPHTHSRSQPSSPSPSLPKALPQTPPHTLSSLPSLYPSHQARQPSVPPTPLIPPAFMMSLRTSYLRTHLPPHLALYTSDLFSAARHHPQLDGMLLSAKAMNDAVDLARAGRVIGRDLTGMELIMDADIEEFRKPTGSLASENGEVSEVDHVLGGSEKGNFRIQVYPPASGAEPCPLHYDHDDGELEPPEEPLPSLDVSEADIARIVPRVMSHRLRVRDGPEDEILGSAVYGAIRTGRREEERVRSTVKDILIKILSEV